MKRSHAFLLSSLLCIAAAPAVGQTLANAPASSSDAASLASSTSLAAIDPKWAASFAAFDAADKLKAPAPGGVLFVGSSSIRMWDGLETQFESLPVVVKRGFGGSRLEDCKTYLSRLVVPYKPRMVLVYAGDNDLAEGRTPQQVLDSFKSFVKGVRAELPDTRIAYISIKPSPSRAALLPSIREANSLIKDYVGNTDNADYIDIFSPMLTTAGTPREELFREDALHLNASGYALWRSVITAHLPARLR